MGSREIMRENLGTPERGNPSVRGGGIPGGFLAPVQWGLPSKSAATGSLPNSCLAIFSFLKNSLWPESQYDQSERWLPLQRGDLWHGPEQGAVSQPCSVRPPGKRLCREAHRVDTCPSANAPSLHLGYRRDGWSHRCEPEAEGKGIPESLTSSQSLPTTAHAGVRGCSSDFILNVAKPKPHWTPFPWHYLSRSVFLLTQGEQLKTA